MSQLGTLEAGSRHDLRVGLSPNAPDEADLRDEEGAFGYVHSYETSSRYDGPGLRVILFLSGCLLRCTYCHNPDTWHLKDGAYVSAEQVIKRLGDFAPALRSLDGGLTISGGEVLVQPAFTRRILAGAKQMGLHTAIQTSGFLGDRADDKFLSVLDLVLLDIKSGDPDTYKRATGRDQAPTLRFAERLAAIGKPVWVRFTLVPGPHRRSRQRREDREIRRPDEERRVGGGATLPSAWRLQMEGDGERIQGSEYALRIARSRQARCRTVPGRGVPRALIPSILEFRAGRLPS